MIYIIWFRQNDKNFVIFDVIESDFDENFPALLIFESIFEDIFIKIALNHPMNDEFFYHFFRNHNLLKSIAIIKKFDIYFWLRNRCESRKIVDIGLIGGIFDENNSQTPQQHKFRLNLKSPTLKGSPHQSHFMFEIYVGKRWIRLFPTLIL